MTQQEIILKLLQENEWVCITDMIKSFIPDYRRRLCDLKDSGYILEGRACKQHEHKSKILKEWALKGHSDPYKSYAVPPNLFA